MSKIVYGHWVPGVVNLLFCAPVIRRISPLPNSAPIRLI